MSPLVHDDVTSIAVSTCAVPACPKFGRLEVSGLADSLSGSHRQGAVPLLVLCCHLRVPTVLDLLDQMGSRY